MKTAVAFLLLVPNLFALDITTLDGKTYLDCRVSRVFPDSICVLWSSGGARIKFSNLPEKVREQYGYDGQKAAVFERSEGDRLARERAELESQRQLSAAKNRATAAQNPVASTPAQTAGANSAASYGDPSAGGYGNGGGNGNNPYYTQNFGGRNGRSGAQYVGVNMAAGIYGISYGPMIRSNPRAYFINSGLLR